MSKKKYCWRQMSASQARTIDDLCRLGRDNLDGKDCWILASDTTVTVTKQKPGENPTESVTLPKREFNRLVRWYLRPQRMRAPSRGKSL